MKGSFRRYGRSFLSQSLSILCVPRDKTTKEESIMKKNKDVSKRIEWSGFGTLEVIIIIAILITVALLFRENIISFAESLINKVFSQSVISEL